MIDKRINDRYQILEIIGGGGMANVYKAHDVILNRTVAVKVLRPQFSEDDEFIRRFRREAQAATSLSHPNVVNIYDVGEEGNLYYIVMEYVDGLTLKQLIQQRGILPLEETVNIMLQILSAIAHAHANHLVHRDIKPHNILISDKGEAKVTDFGIARAMTSATITHTNSLIGSVHYLSPEQARGGMVNEKSDIYSLGIVLYEMVTGKVPFSGDTAVSIAIKHLQTKVPNPRKYNPTIPQSIENIIYKATAKDPFYRYANVKELEADLHTALDPKRLNEEKFEIPQDNDDVTKAIPVIKEDDLSKKDLEQTKVIKPQEENEKQPPKKQKKWLKITLLSAFLLIGASIIAFMIFLNLLQVDEVKIPENLIGMEYEEAYETLTHLDLKVEKELIIHEEIPEGHVVSTNPEVGKFVKVNSSITIFVSEGKEKIEMVDLTRMDKEVARQTLIRLGFKEENIRETAKETNQEENSIIEQLPLSKALVVPEDTIVVLTYSIAAKISLENLHGLSRNEVIEYINKNELTMKSEDRYSEQIPKDHVIEFNPPRGTMIKKGTLVTVVFSLGPEPEPEPEPISTLIKYDVAVSEEDQVAGRIYPVSITYKDSQTKEHVSFVVEQLISKTTSFQIPVTINPNDTAEIKIYIGDELYDTITIPYEKAIENQ